MSQWAGGQQTYRAVKQRNNTINHKKITKHSLVWALWRRSPCHG